MYNNDLARKTFSVTADGVKTRASLINELVSEIDANFTLDRAKYSIITIGSAKFTLQTLAITDSNDIGARYSTMQVGATSIIFNQITLSKINGVVDCKLYRGTADNIVEVSSDVDINGMVYSLTY